MSGRYGTLFHPLPRKQEQVFDYERDAFFMLKCVAKRHGGFHRIAKNQRFSRNLLQFLHLGCLCSLLRRLRAARAPGVIPVAPQCNSGVYPIWIV